MKVARRKKYPAVRGTILVPGQGGGLAVEDIKEGKSVSWVMAVPVKRGNVESTLIGQSGVSALSRLSSGKSVAMKGAKRRLEIVILLHIIGVPGVNALRTVNSERDATVMAA